MLSARRAMDLRTLSVHALGAQARDESLRRHGRTRIRYRGPALSFESLGRIEDLEEIFEFPETTLIRITTSVPSDFDLSGFENTLHRIREHRPHTRLVVGTAMDWLRIQEKTGRPLRERFAFLNSVGGITISGGPAENERHGEVDADSLPLDEVLAVFSDASQEGLRVHATSGYRRGESEDAFIREILALCDFQERTSAIDSLAVVGLPRQRVWTSGLEDLRRTALARLIATNIDEVRVGSQPVGLPLGPCLLHWGANAIDDTLYQPRIGAGEPLSSSSGDDHTRWLDEARWTISSSATENGIAP